MANTELTIGMITRETSRVLKNSLTFTSKVNRDYDDNFEKKGAKIGNVVNVRKPVRSVYASGQGIILQDDALTRRIDAANRLTNVYNVPDLGALLFEIIVVVAVDFGSEGKTVFENARSFPRNHADCKFG